MPEAICKFTAVSSSATTSVVVKLKVGGLLYEEPQHQNIQSLLRECAQVFMYIFNSYRFKKQRAHLELLLLDEEDDDELPQDLRMDECMNFLYHH